MVSLLALAASALSLFASAWYNLDLFRGRVRPNLSSWAIWVFVTMLSSSSYLMASRDIIKSLLALSNSAACILTFLMILWRGRFSKVTWFDVIAGGIGVFAGLVWLRTNSASWGNLIIQFAIAIGCLPIYRSVWIDPTSERPGPWLLWSLSLEAAAVVVLLRWTGRPIEMIYPVMGALLYGGIGRLALRKPKPLI